ncbi:MAG: endonuclease [Gammaproteobacteria bacterium]|nr:endonuclease [Gammaproteobacteria bacterium]
MSDGRLKHLRFPVEVPLTPHPSPLTHHPSPITHYPSPVPRTFLAIFDRLLAVHGPQHWWPGETPFEVMVGAILTQNTAWSNVERAIARLKGQGALDPERLLAAAPATVADWIRSAGYFNVKARRLRNFCHWYLGQGGYDALARRETGALRRDLLSVNGVGPETADDILLYAFERPVFVIDAYTRRLFSRLGLCAPDAGYEPLRATLERGLAHELARARGAGRKAWKRDCVPLYNEYHALIVAHAKRSCRTRPQCRDCCLAGVCPGRR